ncbi:MAG: ribonuclease D [Pseudomonadota bacterium]
MHVITDTDDLAAFCARLAEHPYCTVDTEFMRERTYWPILCLVQAASPDEAAIIDPMAEGIELAPLFELLRNESVVKVFHAARQDVEIFYHLSGGLPRPLFDTQVAAMAAGFGDQIGYEPLARQLVGARIDKGSRFTDWSRRPLSEKQLKYALDDVTHLRGVYEALKERLEAEGRLAWVRQEMGALADPGLYETHPKDAWRRLKLRHVKRRELGVLMKAAEWREREAQGRDIPRGRVAKDETLFEIAKHAPEDVDGLGRLRGFSKGFERSRSAERLLEAVAEGVAIPEANLPAAPAQVDKQPAPPDVVELLRVLLKRQCEAHDVAPKLIASASDLEDIARDDDADVPALRGWRREVFGDAALKLKRGELALMLENGKVRLVEQSAD